MNFNLLLAMLPIFVILFLMLGLRWNAARAGLAGWFTAIAIAGLIFGADIRLLAIAQAKSLLLTLDVLLIVWNAFLLYRVTDEAGAIDIFSSTLPRLTPDRALQALLIGWIFASFLQGVGGFGVPTAVTAPLLVGLGFSPISAVLIPSIGHAWSVTFGSLASSFQALMAATLLPGELLAPYAAGFLALACIGCGLMAAHAAQGFSAVRRLALPITLLGLLMGMSQYSIARRGLWNIAALGGSVAGLIGGYFVARLLRTQKPSDEIETASKSQVLIAFAGYIALVVLTLAVQLIPPLHEALSALTIRIFFPEVQTAQGYVTPAGFGRQIPILRHAGTILALSSLIAYWIFRWTGYVRSGSGRRVLVDTFKRMLSSSLGVTAMVSMAVIMAHAGITELLANGLSNGTGAFFPLVAPWIGGLGAFITGSNTNSNVVFAALQLRTAELLGLHAAIILAAQTTGGAIGSVVAPTKIIVGASTTGAAGKEGIIMRRLIVYVALLIALTSLVTHLTVQLLSV
jgi:lactate permease